MAEKTNSLDWLTIGQAAKYLGVSKDTLRRWEKRGKIKSYRTPGGRRRYTMYDLELAMQPQKISPLTHQPLKRRLPAREEPTIKPSPTPEPTPKAVQVAREEPATEQRPTPETAPEITQPTKRFSTLTTLVLIATLILLALFVFSGAGRVLLPYLESSKEILNPTPKTHSP